MSRAAALLADLVAIPSVNPRGGASDGGETRVAQYVADWAGSHGWRAELRDVLPGRANVVVHVPGELPGTILLQTHSDTVEVEGMTVDPFVVSPGADRRRVTGRGVCDAKGQLALFMAATEQAATAGRPHHPVLLSACVDEEEQFRGVLELCEQLGDGAALSGAVVGEPTELRPVVAHKGVLRGRIVVRGPGGHSSRPEGVTNPIVIAGQVVGYLDEQEGGRLRGMQDDLVGPPALTVTMVQGGEAINIVPREVVLHYDRRTLPHEDPMEVWARLREDLQGRWPDVEVPTPAVADRGLAADLGSDLVRAFMSVLDGRQLDGRGVGVPYGSDASKIARLGIPSVVFGAGSIAQAHTVDEYLDLDQLDTGVDIITELLRSTGVRERG